MTAITRSKAASQRFKPAKRCNSRVVRHNVQSIDQQVADAMEEAFEQTRIYGRQLGTSRDGIGFCKKSDEQMDQMHASCVKAIKDAAQTLTKMKGDADRVECERWQLARWQAMFEKEHALYQSLRNKSFVK
jgi:hypothetical protein